MARVIFAMVISLLMVGQAIAASDAVVFEGGDVRINGTGNGLVFPDGTIQTTKTVEGPQGPAGPQGATGPQGAQGPAGVANGISKGVHGTIDGSSMPSTGSVSGTGYTIARTTNYPAGSYDITFSSAFSGTPDCVVSPAGHTTFSNAPIDCQWSAVSAQGVRVACKAYQPYALPSSHDTTFTFICVY